MESLKAKFSSLLLLLVTCMLTQAQAVEANLPVYQNVIANISLNYDNAMLGGNITLDNGLIMRIVDYKMRDDNVLNTWKAGDVVSFKVESKSDALILSAKRIQGPNEEYVEPYVLLDVTNAPKSGLMIAEINEEGKFVKLNDQSVWDFSWYHQFSTKHWNVGERVLVFGQGDKNSYEFINLDAPVKDNVASANASFVVH